MIEYGTMILLAGIIGMALVEITLPIFREMSGITGNIYYAIAALFHRTFIIVTHSVTSLCTASYSKTKKR